MSTTSEIHNLSKATGQAPEEGSFRDEGGEEEDPRDLRTITQKTLTSIANIMEGAIAPKAAQK
jgi:hypothetical protein